MRRLLAQRRDRLVVGALTLRQLGAARQDVVKARDLVREGDVDRVRAAARDLLA
jgi:hypothetical protein